MGSPISPGSPPICYQLPVLDHPRTLPFRHGPASHCTSSLTPLVWGRLLTAAPQSHMITPPGLAVPVYEEKNIHLFETDAKPIVGLWRVGSQSSWTNESKEHGSADNLKLRTEKGAVNAHVVVTSFARDARPTVDVSSTTGPLTIKMVRTLSLSVSCGGLVLMGIVRSLRREPRIRGLTCAPSPSLVLLPYTCRLTSTV